MKPVYSQPWYLRKSGKAILIPDQTEPAERVSAVVRLGGIVLMEYIPAATTGFVAATPISRKTVTRSCISLSP